MIKDSKHFLYAKQEYEEEVLTNDSIFIQVIDYFIKYMIKKNVFDIAVQHAQQNIWGVVTSSDLAFCITTIAGNYNYWKKEMEHNKINKHQTSETNHPIVWVSDSTVKQKNSQQKDYWILKDKFDDQLEEQVKYIEPKSKCEIIMTREEYLAIIYREHLNAKQVVKSGTKTIRKMEDCDREFQTKRKVCGSCRLEAKRLKI